MDNAPLLSARFNLWERERGWAKFLVVQSLGSSVYLFSLSSVPPLTRSRVD